MKPAGPKATAVAGLRCGRLRPARFYEPQKLSPILRPPHTPILRPIRPVAHPPPKPLRGLGNRAGGFANRKSLAKPSVVFGLRRRARASKMPRRKPGDSSRNRTIHSQNTFRNARSSPAPAESATSTDELQPSACRGGGLRDPKGRKSSAQSQSNTSPTPYNRFRPVRPVAQPPETLRAWATRPATSKGRKSSLQVYCSFGRRAPRVGRRPSAHARRFTESRYSLSAQSPGNSSAQRSAKTAQAIFAPEEPCQPHCGSAVAPPPIAFFPRAGGNLVRTIHHGSNDFLLQQSRAGHFNRRPPGFHLNFAHRKTSEIPLYAGGRLFLWEGTALGPGGPHVPWTGKCLRIFTYLLSPILFPRALGDSFCFASSPKQLNRLLKRRRAVPSGTPK